MTAEVAIINRSAVALAADSALTVSNNKIYNQANKLFELSKFHPVGIMIYGNASYLGVPWEVIIKSYRKNLGTTEYLKLENYADDFLKFLNGTQFHNKVMEDNFVHSIVVELAGVIKKKIDGVSKRTFHKEFKDKCETLCLNFTNFDTLKLAEIIDLSAFSEKYGEDVSALFDEIFAGFKVSKKNHQIALETVYYYLIHNTPNDTSTGIVICGYGKDDIFPKLNCYSVCGVINGHSRSHLVSKCDIQEPHDNGKDTARIFSFAQMDVTSLFIEGVTPDNKQYLLKSFKTSLSLFIDEVIKVAGYGQNSNSPVVTKAMLRTKVDEFMEEYDDQFERYRRDHHIHPMLDVINGLPKEEMASMAEALVELTSLKRKISFDAESVGGPVDVAVISKGDGFIWIKRKYYFDEELNKNFVSRQNLLYQN